MIERQIVKKHMREYLLQEYIKSYLPTGSYSKIDLRKTPLGEKIIIHTSMHYWFTHWFINSFKENLRQFRHTILM